MSIGKNFTISVDTHKKVTQFIDQLLEQYCKRSLREEDRGLAHACLKDSFQQVKQNARIIIPEGTTEKDLPEVSVRATTQGMLTIASAYIENLNTSHVEKVKCTPEEVAVLEETRKKGALFLKACANRIYEKFDLGGMQMFHGAATISQMALKDMENATLFTPQKKPSGPAASQK